MAAASIDSQYRAQGAEGAGGIIGRRQLGRENRLIFRSALGPRHAHHGLGQGIDAGPVRVWPGTPITGQMGLDQLRVIGRANTHALGRAGAQVGQQSIRGGGDALDDLLAIVGACIYRDGAFVEVQIVKVCPTNGPGQIAAKRLELDDVGAQISQQASTRGPRDEIGNLQNANAVQRQRIRRALGW